MFINKKTFFTTLSVLVFIANVIVANVAFGVSHSTTFYLTVIAVPHNVTVVPGPCRNSLATMEISWDRIPTATSYKLYRTPITPATNVSPITISQPVSGNRVTFEDAGLALNGLYGYQVSAVIAGGEGGKSGPQSDFTIASCSVTIAVSLSCAGLSLNAPACTAEYNGSVDLVPQGFSQSSCTPSSSNPAHSGWNNPIWLVSSPDGSGYKNFSASGGQYTANSLDQKEYKFTFSCQRDSATPVSKSANVCVIPPPVLITGSSPNSSTIVVTWNKPAIHNSFGLYYKLNIDRLSASPRTINISNTDTTYCDSVDRVGAPYGQCTYTDTGLTAGSLHNYQLQVLVDYVPPCDPISTLSANPAEETNVVTSSCAISLGVNNLSNSNLDWYPGDSSPTIKWKTANIALGSTCFVDSAVGNIDGFTGSQICPSDGVLRSSPQLDLSGLSPATYSTRLKFETNGIVNCLSRTVSVTKNASPLTNFSLSAYPKIIELVAVGSPVGKTGLISSKATITVTKAVGFIDPVILSVNDIVINGVAVGKVTLTSAGISDQYTLQASSRDSNNPIPDGTYNITINGLSSAPSNIIHSVGVTLKVRTVSPGYEEY